MYPLRRVHGGQRLCIHLQSVRKLIKINVKAMITNVCVMNICTLACSYSIKNKIEIHHTQSYCINLMNSCFYIHEG